MDREKARKRAEALVSRMTVEERASQLRFDAPAIERLGVPAYNWWNEALHGLARGGTATSFPQAVGLAAMFDDELLEEIAAAISTEARAKYNAYSAELSAACRGTAKPCAQRPAPSISRYTAGRRRCATTSMPSPPGRIWKRPTSPPSGRWYGRQRSRP